MVGLVNFKESLIYFYQKREDIIRPLLKIMLSLFVLFGTQQIFGDISSQRLVLGIVVVSLIQAFLPTVFVYLSASALAMYHLYSMSPDLFLGFFILFLIALLTYIRIDSRTACITVAIPVLFMLRLQYLIPVALGITLGFSGVFPAVFGTLFYYMFHYAGEAGNLLSHTPDSDMGVGLSRVVDLMLMDKEILIILVTFSLVIFITALLYHMFYELAWFLSIAFGNVAMAFLLLCGRYIFELNNEVWLFLAEAVISVLLCTILQFFRGIGDISRMEKTTFEDDDYIYYVKVVPKIKVTQKNRNVTDISSENAEKIEAEQQTAASETEEETVNRKRRTDRKKTGFFGRRKKEAGPAPDEQSPETPHPQKENRGEDLPDKEPAGKETADNKDTGQAPADMIQENKNLPDKNPQDKDPKDRNPQGGEMTDRIPPNEDDPDKDVSKKNPGDKDLSNKELPGTKEQEVPDSDQKGKTEEPPADQSPAKPVEEQDKPARRRKKKKAKKLNLEEVLQESIEAASELSEGKDSGSGKD